MSSTGPRTVYRTATSLDGFIADEQHSLDWLFEVPENADDEASFGRFMDTVGALVMGRSTYEWVVENDDLLEEPEKWQASFGDRPTWVMTHRTDLPEVPGSGIRFASGSVADLHPEVVAAAGGRDVWVMGGGELVGQYADAGLLDRVLLDITPVFLGAGAPLLPRRLTGGRLTLSEMVREGQRAHLVYEVGPPGPSDDQ